MSVQRVQAVMTGRVQGVGFRWYCREQAVSRGVAGYVRNLPDGRVEAVFEGEERAVEAMVEWCRRGPSSAGVVEVEVQHQPPTGEIGFRIAR